MVNVGHFDTINFRPFRYSAMTAFFGDTKLIMNEKIKKAYENKRLQIIYMIAAGVFAGLLEGVGISPVLCLIGMLPLFSVLECRQSSAKKRIAASVKRLVPFLAAYNFTKTCFLLTLYVQLDFPPAAGILLCFGAAFGTALIMFTAQLLCISVFAAVKTDKAFDVILLPLLFSFSELICENIGLMSFPWLGVWAQADGAEAVLMSASLFGCRFTSFIILLAVGTVYLALRSIFLKKYISAVIPLCCCLALAAAVFIFGNMKIKSLKAQSADAPTVNTLAVQLDCEGYEKDSMTAWEAADEYARLIKDYIGSSDTMPDLVFLPETAVHASFDNGDAFRIYEKMTKENGFTAALGCFRREDGKKYNSVIVYTPDGLSQSFHDKRHLIPFGEYMPFSNLTGADRLLYEPSEYGDMLVMDDIGVACGICIESIYSDSFVHQVRQGAQLIYIPTNDSWFGDSFARRAHYLHSKMRAIENSRFAVRAGNCGISSVITPWGSELAVENGKQKAVVDAQTPLLSGKSLYTKVGDIFGAVPWICVLAAVVINFRRRRSDD